MRNVPNWHTFNLTTRQQRVHRMCQVDTSMVVDLPRWCGGPRVSPVGAASLKAGAVMVSADPSSHGDWEVRLARCNALGDLLRRTARWDPKRVALSDATGSV